MKKLTILITLCLVAGIAEAKSAGKLQKACSKEIKQFCPTVKGDTNIYNCLEEHDSKISKSCDKEHEAYGIANGLEKKDDK